MKNDVNIIKRVILCILLAAFLNACSGDSSAPNTDSAHPETAQQAPAQQNKFDQNKFDNSKLE